VKSLRQIHLYLGCIFAPLIIYFCLSGVWQVFRFNDVPRDQTPTWSQSLFHELSKPHTNSTLPGLNPKTDRSTLFGLLACSAGIGMIATALIGILLGLRFARKPKLVLFCLVAGFALPIALLFLR
jgi:hypothetical protein